MDEKKFEQALYQANDKKISHSDFVDALKELGIKRGDTIMVHSDISSFGKLLTFDRNLLLQTLIDSIKETVGSEGIIIMPTFTYSFFKNEPYDTENSKSTVGVLTEFFRKQPGVSRTVHPNHSVAIFGKNKDRLLNIGKDTFDDNSIFGKLCHINGKQVFFGIPFHLACTFSHYIEQKHKVPYRYKRQYRGKIIDKDKKYEDVFTINYRYSFFFNDILNLEKHIVKKGLLKEVKVGKGKISVIDSDVLLKEGLNLLDKDCYFLIKNRPFIFRLFNMCAYPFLRYAPWAVKIIDRITSKFLP